MRKGFIFLGLGILGTGGAISLACVLSIGVPSNANTVVWYKGVDFSDKTNLTIAPNDQRCIDLNNLYFQWEEAPAADKAFYNVQMEDKMNRIIQTYSEKEMATEFAYSTYFQLLNNLYPALSVCHSLKQIDVFRRIATTVNKTDDGCFKVRQHFYFSNLYINDPKHDKLRDQFILTSDVSTIKTGNIEHVSNISDRSMNYYIGPKDHVYNNSIELDQWMSISSHSLVTNAWFNDWPLTGSGSGPEKIVFSIKHSLIFKNFNMFTVVTALL